MNVAIFGITSAAAEELVTNLLCEQDKEDSIGCTLTRVTNTLQEGEGGMRRGQCTITK